MNTIERDSLIEALQKIEDEFPTTREHILITIKKTKDFILSLPTNTESREVEGLPDEQVWEKWFREFKRVNGETPNSLETFEWIKEKTSSLLSEKDNEIGQLKLSVTALRYEMKKYQSQLSSSHTPPVAEVRDERPTCHICNKKIDLLFSYLRIIAERHYDSKYVIINISGKHYRGAFGFPEGDLMEAINKLRAFHSLEDLLNDMLQNNTHF